MADTTTVETATPEVVKNDVTPVATPPSVNSNDNSEVEKLRKELEQSQMRANQLENEKKKREEADADIKRKQLEDQEQWKEVAEQEKAKREALETEKQEAETKQTLSIAEQSIFAEFSPEAIEVAQEAGLTLTEDSDEAKNTLKSKLEKIQAKVITGNTVTPNNPGNLPETNDRAQLVQAMRNGDKQAKDKVISTLPVLDVMRAQAGYTKQ